MADTRNDVTLTKDTWVDLYAATGISVGTAVSVLNKGSTDVYVAIKATSPTGATFGVPVYSGSFDNMVTISASESGLWAYSGVHNGIVLVQEV